MVKPIDITQEESINAIIETYWRKRDEQSINDEKFRLWVLFQDKSHKNRAKRGRQLFARQTDKKHIHFANSNEHLQAIEDELDEHYHVSIDHLPLTANARIKFLAKKHRALLHMAQLKKRNARGLVPNDTTPVLAGEKRSNLRAIFDILKKGIDLIDDAWYVVWTEIQDSIPEFVFELVSDFTTSIISAIVLGAEAYQGLKEAWHAYRHKEDKLSQRKTRIAAGLFIAAAGITGVGLSVALFAAGFGAAIAGLFEIPIIIPCLLFMIYATELVKYTYILNETKKHENAMLCFLEEAANKLAALSRNPTADKDDAFINCQEAVSLRKQDYEFLRAERLQAERNVAFKTLEVIAFTSVLVGTILALTIAASVATFGVAAMVLLIGGMALGLAFKLTEFIDNKCEHKPTNFIRQSMVNSYQSITDKLRQQPKPVPNKHPTHAAVKPKLNLKAPVLRAVIPESAAGTCPGSIHARQRNFY